MELRREIVMDSYRGVRENKETGTTVEDLDVKNLHRKIGWHSIIRKTMIMESETTFDFVTCSTYV